MTQEELYSDEELVTRVAASFDEMAIPNRPCLQDLPGLAPHAHRGSWQRMSWRQRVALGGAGLSTAAALTMLMLTLYSTGRLSAMEKVARQLREVTSYSYTVSSINTSIAVGGQRRTTWTEDGEVHWQAPDAFRFEDRITRTETPPPRKGPPQELLEHFVEVFPAGGPGMLIDHKRKTYLNEGFAPEGSRTYPWYPLKMIREGQGEFVSELGVREIAGKQARGYVTRFTSGDPPREHAWHVWVDPATDLPVEIGYQVDDGQEPRRTTVLKVGNFRWNQPLAASLFQPVAPKDYREVSAPRGDAGKDQEPQSHKDAGEDGARAKEEGA